MKARWLCLGVVLLAGCTAVPSDVDPTPAQSAPEQAALTLARTPETAAPRTWYQPQLARKASLSLEVKDAETARWTRAAGGEVLNLTDNGVTGEVRRLTLEVQVPAMRLDEVLMQFSSLGRLENREVTAEDVSNQLVDVGARLRNLRQAEALLLQIFDDSPRCQATPDRRRTFGQDLAGCHYSSRNVHAWGGGISSVAGRV